MRRRGLAILIAGLSLFLAGAAARADQEPGWQALAARWLAERHSSEGERWSVSVIQAPESGAEGAEIINASGDKARLKKIMKFQVRTKAGTPGELLVRCGRLRRAAVANRLLQRGEILEARDWHWEERNAELLPMDAVRVESQLAKQRVCKHLASRETITVHALEPVPDVPVGKRLLLRIQGDGVVISTEAETLQEGRLGEMIRVKHLQTGRRLLACVTGPEAAEVVLTQRR